MIAYPQAVNHISEILYMKLECCWQCPGYRHRWDMSLHRGPTKETFFCLSEGKYIRNTSEISVSAKDLERSDTNCERLTENVEDSTLGGFHDNLQIGVIIEDEFDNVELKECLTQVEGITPVSNVPVLCPIASFVSVEKRTEEIVDGSTLA